MRCPQSGAGIWLVNNFAAENGKKRRKTVDKRSKNGG
jgi:hypothetical protein